ncbi:hypothetical protein CGMCC3_g9879 [Colletotrichum fructicola]|nr:uncharacterized protein CGMCC3_g9879 [Colletotrichum fructicola]KAE9574031.1 hypothetical protein CGMCC3_g9879 [Colletotrichum fructicola]
MSNKHETPRALIRRVKPSSDNPLKAEKTPMSEHAQPPKSAPPPKLDPQ